jgi:cystathionine beta-lyase/cystathionine gamma-synthase
MTFLAEVIELGDPRHPANPDHPQHEAWKRKVAEQAKNPAHPAHPTHPEHAAWRENVARSQGKEVIDG